jgi:general nucleoside transport system ATP-binding protein
LRIGRVSGSARIGDVTLAELATLMVGRDVTTPHAPRSAGQAAVRLSVDRLASRHVGPLSFEIRAGEVLGVAGVDGNGQFELVETLAGLRPATGGSIRLDDRELARASVAGRVDAGLAYMPADRGQTALVKSMSVAENLMLRDSRRPPFASGAFLSPAGVDRKANALMQAYDIRAPSVATRTASLSGGNQQKIVVAREFDRKPAALIAHQPAWGLDPGATRFVIEQTLALREAGAAILYVSSELEEVLDVSDRIAVMADGQFVGIVPRADVDLAQIGLWMSGRAA